MTLNSYGLDLGSTLLVVQNNLHQNGACARVKCQNYRGLKTLFKGNLLGGRSIPDNVKSRTGFGLADVLRRAEDGSPVAQCGQASERGRLKT